jgi:hypothetical protein
VSRDLVTYEQGLGDVLRDLKRQIERADRAEDRDEAMRLRCRRASVLLAGHFPQTFSEWLSVYTRLRFWLSDNARRFDPDVIDDLAERLKGKPSSDLR